MKKKIPSLLLCSLLAALLLSSCGKYDEVKRTLNEITIQNTLPIVDENDKYTSVDDIDELVYEQQIEACGMFTDTYNKTSFKQFEDGKYKKKTLEKLCQAKRQEIDLDIATAFDINIYKLLKNTDDCSNMDAYVIRSFNDVADFYDIYDRYKNGDDPNGTLVDMILEYSEHSNLLAYKFLDKNDTKVFKAALMRISDNVESDEYYRQKITENNRIVSALNTIYGGVPEEYSEKIDELNTMLAAKLIRSMKDLTPEQRKKYLEELYPSTPSPSPTATATVQPTAVPKPTVTATQRPLATAIPMTPRPTARPTAAPTQRPTSAPTSTPRPAATAVPQPTDTPYEPIFGFDDSDNNSSEYEFE